MHGDRIKNIYLHLTRRCNLRCLYCYFDAGDPLGVELSAGQLRRLFRDIALLKPEKVVFTGGEPLLRTDLFGIAADARRTDGLMGTRLCLMSNGTLIDEASAHLIAAAFDEVRISLDGPRDIHDLLRGDGTFAAASRAVRLLRIAGLPPGVSITATSQNSNSLEDFLETLLDELYVSDIHISPFRPVGRGAGQPQLGCSWRAVQSIIAGFWQKRFGLPKNLKQFDSYTLASCGNCSVGCHINILPDGTVYPCHVLSIPGFLLGNIREASLPVILQDSLLLKKLRGINLKNAGFDVELTGNIADATCWGEVLRDAPEKLRKLLLQDSPI